MCHFPKENYFKSLFFQPAFAVIFLHVSLYASKSKMNHFSLAEPSIKGLGFIYHESMNQLRTIISMNNNHSIPYFLESLFDKKYP